ncbi:hypothetical protein [Streptosporangium sp. NPDC006007]|uniref:hypothetical protein n=1 Tax=Streptosporangium sp. NPDC006007 TaxID=3154575 RepID=UPI0033B06E3B
MSRITLPAASAILPAARAGSSRGLRRAVTAAVGLALVGTLAQAPAPAAAAVPGRVCMFSYPKEPSTGRAWAGYAGHVGWAFKTGPDRWTWGSFLPAKSPWASSWTWVATQGKFRQMGYSSFRCKDTHRMGAAVATTKWKELLGTRYRLLYNNCLTTSVDIFRAYTTELGSLPSGVGQTPNRYFNGTLRHYGFGGAWPL